MLGWWLADFSSASGAMDAREHRFGIRRFRWDRVPRKVVDLHAVSILSVTAHFALQAAYREEK
jgi:hypothetical protein